VVKKFFDKINGKRAPPPPKPAKNETEEANKTESEQPSSEEPKEDIKDESK